MLHGLLAAAVPAMQVPAAAKLLAWLTIGLHALKRRPRPPGLILWADGLWSLPAADAFNLTLDPGTTYSTWWVSLVLARGRVRHRRLVLRDQLEPEAWRRLQLALREHGGAPVRTRG